MLDLPLPFNPVIALNCGSNPETVVRVAYDLNPSITTCLMYIFKQKRSQKKDINSVYQSSKLGRLFLAPKPSQKALLAVDFLVPSLLARNSTQPTQEGIILTTRNRNISEQIFLFFNIYFNHVKHDVQSFSCRKC